ncbi:MAG: hypothetical protein ABFE01_15690 [Phycisphaerales bacterium]
MMEELDAAAQQRREMFALYGLAMYHAQCVEKSLAILVSSVLDTEFLSADIKRRVEIQDDVFSKTIGRLLTRMRKQVRVSADLDQILDEAWQKRNWLAHEYFWPRAGEAMTTRGRDKMIDELTELSGFFSEVDARLTSIYERWAKKIGIPQPAIDETLSRLIEDNE